MKRGDVDVFEKLAAQLYSLYQEMSALAKKLPNDAINTFKLRFVNGTLSQCNEFLGQRYRPFADFESFSADDMPSNSDVTFIISQYIECAEKFRADNIRREIDKWYWNFDDDGGAWIRTPTPKKLIRK